MMTNHIVSPLEGTQWKVKLNYTGVRDKEFYQDMLLCDSQKLLVVQIVKQFNRPDCQNFDVFGRVLSGTLKKGDMLKIFGENYNLEDEEDMVVKPV